MKAPFNFAYNDLTCLDLFLEGTVDIYSRILEDIVYQYDPNEKRVKVGPDGKLFKEK